MHTTALWTACCLNENFGWISDMFSVTNLENSRLDILIYRIAYEWPGFLCYQEKVMGWTPMEMMDRDRACIPKLQIGFLDGIALPVYRYRPKGRLLAGELCHDDMVAKFSILSTAAGTFGPVFNSFRQLVQLPCEWILRLLSVSKRGWHSSSNTSLLHSDWPIMCLS